MERRRSSGTITNPCITARKGFWHFADSSHGFHNLGTGLNVSYAGTADQVTFQMKGADW